MYFMSTGFLKDEINEVHFQKLQLAYICDKTHTSHRNLGRLCREVHYMWWGNQDL